MPLLFGFIFESNLEMFFIILDMIKSVLKISLALLKRISSFAHIFIFFVLQIFLPWDVNKYTSY